MVPSVVPFGSRCADLLAVKGKQLGSEFGSAWFQIRSLARNESFAQEASLNPPLFFQRVEIALSPKPKYLSLGNCP